MRRPNQFDFKKFSISQTHAAMKVCTDSCAFGGLIDASNCKSIIDIGAGTGLLSLMLAQRTNDDCIIDAVEIDDNAIIDAQANFENSLWNSRISLHHCSIQEFCNRGEKKYDVIICNPPFHDKSTKSSSALESKAHHADISLPFHDLLQCVVSLSNENTRFWCILPTNEMNYFQELAEEFKLFPQTIISMHDVINDKPIRITCEFQFNKIQTIEHQFVYRESKSGPHTQQYSEVMKEYFLFL